MQFIANLRKQTIDSFVEVGLVPDGYLLSTHRITPAFLYQASQIRAAGIDLYADNGTKSHIENIIRQFKAPSRQLLNEVATIRRSIGRIPRGADIPSDLRRKAAELAQSVVNAATLLSESIDSGQLLDQQLSMDPTHLIAQEDFATACLIGLGLERTLTGWGISRINTRNRRSIRLSQKVRADQRCAGRQVYTVLSAMDFNTARSAGRIAAEAGVTDIALGMVGIMRDPYATNYYVMGYGSYKLNRPVRRRYVRFAQIIAGLFQGYHDRGRLPTSFHALGMGASAMFPFLALAGQNDSVLLTADATSPIHDATRDRVLYEPSRAADRISCTNIVKRIMAGGDWIFDTPFCKIFRQNHGHNAHAARKWWHQNSEPDISDSLLKNSTELEAHLPLFTKVDADLSRTARHTHVAHNHLVISNLARSLQPGQGAKQIARKIITEMKRQYATSILRGIVVMDEIFSNADIT